MNNNIKKIIYYIIIILLFVVFDKILFYFNNDNEKNILINNTLKLQSDSLKSDIEELTKIKYDNYNYIIGKITYKNLYNSDTYYIEYDGTLNDKLVINNNGLIGIVKNHILTKVSDLSLSVRINDNYGILKNNEIKIINGDYKIGDKIYTSGLTSINENLLIGYVSDIKNYELETIIKVDYIKIDTNYVVILK